MSYTSSMWLPKNLKILKKKRQKGQQYPCPEEPQACSLFNAICFPVKVLLLIAHGSAGLLGSQADVPSAIQFENYIFFSSEAQHQCLYIQCASVLIRWDVFSRKCRRRRL